MPVPDDGKEIATQSIRDWLDDGERGSRCDRGIDGVAAFEQHADPRL